MASPLTAHFSPDLLTRILDAYGFDDPASFVQVPMPQGFGLPVTRARGRDADLVIKQVNGARSPECRQFALDLHAHLHAAGVPCARPYRTRGGALLLQLPDGDFVVQSWCQGEPVAYEDASAAEMATYRHQVGRLLGQIHAAGRSGLGLGNASCRRTAQEAVSGISPIEEHLPWSRAGRIGHHAWLHLKERHPFGHELRRALPLLTQARQQLQRTGLAADPRLAELIPVHADINFENILFDDGHLVAIVDFDAALVAPRALDVGSALAVICERREGEDVFLAGYEAASGLPRPDADLIRFGVLLRLVRSLTFQILAYTHRRAKSPTRTRWWIQRLLDSLAVELSSENEKQRLSA